LTQNHYNLVSAAGNQLLQDGDGIFTASGEDDPHDA